MIIVIFGTRPELIKQAPVIHELKRQGLSFKTINTGQHKEMLDPLLKWFDIIPDYDLSIMKSGQTLNGIIHSSILLLDEVFENEKPDIIITQGDTTTAFVASIAAFNKKIKVGHVEAGLRTNNLYNPFPEEANRRLISQIASFHFAPTSLNANNLIKSGIPQHQIYETGNTVIDALFYTKSKLEYISFLDAEIKREIAKYEKIITVTGHRRENIGAGQENIFEAIKEVSKTNKDILFIYPVHLNPLVKTEAERILLGLPNVLLTKPMDYPAFVELMSTSYIIISDSGGVQEEAPSLNVPVLVTRTNTERTEAVDSGAVMLVGTEKENIVNKINELLQNKILYNKMSTVKNPYGDGGASAKIVSIFKNHG